MQIKKAKFKTAKPKFKTEKIPEIKLPDIEPSQGIMVGTGSSKQEMDAAYRNIRSALMARKGHKYRIIRLIKSFLIYRTK